MIDVPASDLTYQKINFSRNRLEHRIPPADTGIVDRSSIQYLVDILVPEYSRSSTFTEMTPGPIPVRERPAVVQGSTTILEGAFLRIEELLDGFLEYKKPDSKQNTLKVAAQLTMPYQVREEVLSTVTTRTKQWILKAGIRREDEGFLDIFWTSLQAEKQRFLTWQPDLKHVTYAQEEYLYFLLNFTPLPSQVKLRGQLFFTDGSHSDAQTFKTLNSPFLNDVLIVPVGMQVLDLLTYVPVGKQLWRYQVWLSNESDAKFSEVRTYFYDAEPGLSRFLLFSNSLGGFDTLRMRGKASEQVKVSRTTAQRDTPADSGVEFSDIYVTYIEGDRELTVSTGYLRYENIQLLEYLQELLFAEEIYLITDKGHLPLELVSNQLLTNDDDADLVARTFTFKRANKERSYSILPAAPATSVRATAWRGVETRYVLDSLGKRTGMVLPARLEKYYIDDNSVVFPYTSKPNVPGDENYIPPSPAPGVAAGSTPYPSAGIVRETTFKRQGCASGLEGTTATIIIAAGKYGGEASGDADILAEAEYASKNTQEYVNMNGACVAAENYEITVPAAHFHFRTNAPSQVGIYNTATTPNRGNIQALQGQTGIYIFPTASNDLDFPIDNTAYYYHVYGTPGQTYQVRVYRNGVMRKNQNITMNASGYENAYMFDVILTTEGYSTYSPASGDKFYIKVLPL